MARATRLRDGELAECLPCAARAARARWPTTTAGRGCRAARAVRRPIDPERWELLPAQPGSAAAGGLRALAEAGRRGRRRWWSVRPRSRSRLSTPISSARTRTARCDPHAAGRVLLRRVRHPPLAAGLLRRARRARRRPLKEASDRALPMVAVGLMYRQGYFRQRIDAGGLAARVLDRHRSRAAAGGARDATDDGEPLTVSGADRRGRGACAQIWRVDVGRVPLYLLDTDRPENDAARALDHRAPVRRRSRARVSRSTSCSASAGCARCAHSASSPARSTSTRATPRWRRSSSRAPSVAARRVAVRAALAAARQRARCSPRTRPVPAGNDSYPADEVERGHRRPRRRAAASVSDADRAGPHEPRRRRRAVRRHAARAAPEPQRPARQPPPRRGRAGDVARAVAGRGRVEEVPIGHVTNGVHVPTWVGGPMRELLDRHLGAGLARRAPTTRDLGRRSTRSRTPSCGRCARRSARAARATSCASAASSDRLARGEHPRVRRGRRARLRPRRADDRLRAPRRDLQAARPADAATPSGRCALLGGERPGAGRARRQGPPARRRGQATCCRRCSGCKRRAGRRPSGSSFLDDYDLDVGAAARARAATCG